MKKMSLMLGLVVAGCGATGKISLGDDAKALIKANEVTPVTTECSGEAKHPNICCRGEACYAWLDDPFRPCEFGYENVFDGSKCCTPGSANECTPIPPPEACSPTNTKACPKDDPDECSPSHPENCPSGPTLPPDPDICGPENPGACVTAPGDENASCMTVDGNSVVSVNILNGVVSKLFDFSGSLGHQSSMAMAEGSLLFCEIPTGTMKRIRMAGDTHVVEDVASEPCEAVTADGSMIWVQSMSASQSLKGYPSIAAVSANTPSVTHNAPFASRLGPGQGELLGAWHSDSKIMRVNRQTGATIDVPLQGYDGWIFGVSAARGGRIVVSSPTALGGSGTLHVFDQGGKLVRKVGRPSSFHGLGFQGLFCEYQGTSKPQP